MTVGGVLDGDPVCDHLAQLRHFHRLGHVSVHAGFPGTLAVFAEDVCGQRDHRRAGATCAGFPLA